MMKAALALIAVFALASAANELIPNPTDLHPLQGDGPGQIYVQRQRFGGNDFGVMYRTENDKAQATGYCLWQNSSSLETCGADHDSRIVAFVESLKNPALVCESAQYQFNIENVAGQLKITTSRFWGIGEREKEGMIFKQIASNEALMTKTTGSDCPVEITQKSDPSGLALHICMSDIASTSANYQIHDPIKNEKETNILRCKDLNGFVKAAALK